MLAAAAGVALLGVVCLRRVGIDWARASRWEQAVGDAGVRYSFEHSHFGRGLDVVLLIVVPLGAILLAPAVSGLYHLGEHRLAAACVVLFFGSFSSSELLKATLHQRFDVPHRLANGYPSGHTTVAFATGIVLVLAGPRRGRLTAIAAAAGYAAFVAAGVVLDGWHLPTDALGALCVTSAWTFAALAVFDPPVRVAVTWRDAANAAILTALAVALLLTHVGASTDSPFVRAVAEAVVVIGAAAGSAMLVVAYVIALLGDTSRNAGSTPSR